MSLTCLLCSRTGAGVCLDMHMYTALSPRTVGILHWSMAGSPRLASNGRSEECLLPSILETELPLQLLDGESVEREDGNFPRSKSSKRMGVWRQRRGWQLCLTNASDQSSQRLAEEA